MDRAPWACRAGPARELTVWRLERAERRSLEAGARRVRLMEVVAVLLIVAVSVAGAHALASRAVTARTRNAQRAAARLVEDRIDVIRTDPAWDSLVQRYAGTEHPVAGSTPYKRVTQLAKTRSSTAAGVPDCIVVTVEVSGTGLRQPVRRTTMIASP